MKITRELFEEQRCPKFGNANPERMNFSFWEWMIRGEDLISEEGGKLAESGLLMRDGKLKSAYGPHRARDLFNIPTVREDGPIWTFDRMGATRTRLTDGRVVCIGGEHEDFYDPDFCIYNDVVVFGPNERIDIYGYPKEIFPPTDFHTATLSGDRIIVIGSIGYQNERQPHYTPVYVLDLKAFQISKLETAGETPGWISKHQAKLEASEVITIHDGRIMRESGKGQRFVRNLEHFSLDLKSGRWCRLTNRKWHQFNICRDDKKPFMLKLKPRPSVDELLPRTARFVALQSESGHARIAIEGVPISVDVGFREIEVVVEGQLAESILEQFSEEVRKNAEAAVQHCCILERF